MPRVPQEQATEQLRPIPSARLTAAPSAEALGAGLGEATARQGVQLYEQALREADQTALVEAETKLTKLATDLQIRANEFQGEDAAKAPDFVAQRWHDGTAEIEQGVKNDRVRAAVARRKALHEAQLYDHTQRQTYTAIKAHQEKVDQAGIQAAIDMAVVNPDHSGAVSNAETTIAGIVADRAARRGEAGTEVHRASERDTLSTLHLAVITALVNGGHDLAAQARYEAVKETLDAKASVTAQKLVEAGSSRQAGFELAQTAVRGAREGGDRTVPDTEEAQLAYVREYAPSPTIRDVAVHEIKARWDERRRQDKQAHEQAFQNALAAVPHGSGVNPRLAVKPSDAIHLTQSEWDILDDRTKPEKTDRLNNDPKWLAFNALKGEDVAKLSESEFRSKYWLHFDNAKRDRAVTQWNAAIDKKDPSGEKFIALRTPMQAATDAFRVSSLVADASVEPVKYNKVEAKRYIAFIDAVQKKVTDYEKAHGKVVDPTVLDGIIKEEITRASKDVWISGGGLFGGAAQKKMVDVAENELGQGIVPEAKMDPIKKDKLKRIFQNRGRLVDLKTLERAYFAAERGDQALFDRILAEKPSLPAGVTAPAVPAPANAPPAASQTPPAPTPAQPPAPAPAKSAPTPKAAPAKAKKEMSDEQWLKQFANSSDLFKGSVEKAKDYLYFKYQGELGADYLKRAREQEK